MNILKLFRKSDKDEGPISPKSSDEKLLAALREAVKEEQKVIFKKETPGGYTSWYADVSSRFIEQCFFVKQQRRALWFNAGLVVLTAVSALVATFSFLHGLKIDQAINRPYLNFDTSNSKLVLVDDFVKTRRISPQKFETFITNVGNRPAYFRVQSLKYNGYPNLVVTPEENAEGVIFPNQKIRLAWIVWWDEEGEDYRKWVKEKMNPVTWCVFCDVHLTLGYDILGARSKNSYFTTLISEYTPSHEGRILKSEYSFRIVDAK